MLTGWQSMPEKPPSALRDDQPTVARFLAMLGVLLVAIGVLAHLAPSMGWTYAVGAGWGAFFLSLGLVLVLYHAFVDADVQFRRVYTGLGLLLAAIGVLLRVLPLGGSVGALFVPFGIYALALALLFLFAVLRNETSPTLKAGLLRLLGTLGAVMILAGIVVGQWRADFLAVEGVLLLILGLLYVTTYIGMQDPVTGAGYYAGILLGVAGAVCVLVTVVRIFMPVAEAAAGDTSDGFLVPSGLILLAAGFTYMAFAFGVCSDWTLLVLVRRELAAFFYSPMAYLVLLAMMFVAWINFFLFIQNVMRDAGPRAA